MKTPQTFVQTMALNVADLYELGGSCIAAPDPVAHAAANGNPVKLGMCIAAKFLQTAMCQHPDGLAAFGDLVHKPRLHDVQGE